MIYFISQREKVKWKYKKSRDVESEEVGAPSMYKHNRYVHLPYQDIRLLIVVYNMIVSMTVCLLAIALTPFIK